MRGAARRGAVCRGMVRYGRVFRDAAEKYFAVRNGMVRLGGFWRGGLRYGMAWYVVACVAG